MLFFYLFALYLLHSSAAQRQQRPIPSPNVPNPAANDIIAQVSDVNPDGSFYTKWQTANGITVEEQGSLKNPGREDEAEQVQGSASWTTNEGQRISITWQADENGAVFQGDHLPTAPPAPEIPPLIQKALEWIAANPSKLSTDNEGQYREDDGAGLPQPQGLVPRRPAPRRF